MKHRTSISTDTRVTLDPAEWFTIKGAKSVVEVDQIQVSGFEIETGERQWSITCSGHRMLKNGTAGSRYKMSTYEHTGTFGPEAEQALWDALPDSVKSYLTTLGVFA